MGVATRSGIRQVNTSPSACFGVTHYHTISRKCLSGVAAVDQTCRLVHSTVDFASCPTQSPRYACNFHFLQLTPSSPELLLQKHWQSSTLALARAPTAHCFSFIQFPFRATHRLWIVVRSSRSHDRSGGPPAAGPDSGAVRWAGLEQPFCPPSSSALALLALACLGAIWLPRLCPLATYPPCASRSPILLPAGHRLLAPASLGARSHTRPGSWAATLRARRPRHLVLAGPSEQAPTPTQQPPTEAGATPVPPAAGTTNGVGPAGTQPQQQEQQQEELEPLPALELDYTQPTAGQRAWTHFKLAFALPWRRFKSGAALVAKVCVGGACRLVACGVALPAAVAPAGRGPWGLCTAGLYWAYCGPVLGIQWQQLLV